MGQYEILKALEKSEMPMASREIAEATGERINEVITCLGKLLKQKEVKCIEINRHKALKHFGSKRKLRIFYLNKSDLIRAKKTVAYL